MEEHSNQENNVDHHVSLLFLLNYFLLNSFSQEKMMITFEEKQNDDVFVEPTRKEEKSGNNKNLQIKEEFLDETMVRFD